MAGTIDINEYYAALLRQRNLYRAQGNNLVNPTVSNDISALAGLDTSFQQGVDDTNVPTDRSDKDPLSQIFGFVDEIAAKFGAGFVAGWEGGLDLIATGIGALGDSTGWYNGETFTDWAKQDIGTELAEWTKTYANFTPWAIWKNTNAFGMGTGGWENSNYGNSKYWEGMWEGAKDIGSSGLFFSNQIKDYREDSNKYYGFNDDVLTEMGGFGNFLGGAAHSIGFMLPSIMTGGAASAAGAGSTAAKAVSLGVMGLSAAGKGSEEALNEGASSGQALAYGAASGAVEVASEIIVGPALAKIGAGTGAVAGVVGGKSVGKIFKKGGAELAKTIAKTAFEEGMEEVFSGAFDPLIKSIYKGADALDEYKDPQKFIIGEGPLDQSSLLGQFTSGAFVGVLSGGIAETKAYKALGADGYKASHALSECMESAKTALEAEQKFGRDSDAYKKATDEFGRKYAEFAKYIEPFLQNATQKQFKNFAKLLNNPQAFEKALKEGDFEGYINKAISELKDLDKISIREIHNQFNDKFDLNTELVFENFGNKKGNAYIDGNTIHVNEKVLSKKGGEAWFHEYAGHNLGKALSQSQKKEFFNEVPTNIKNEVADAYWNDKKTKAKEKYKTKAEFKKSLLYQEEVIASYIQRAIAAESTGKALANIRRTLKPSIIQKMLSKFSRNKYQSPNLLKRYLTSVNSLLKNISNGEIVNAAKKYAMGKHLNDKEKFLKKQYAGYFKLVKEVQAVAYSLDSQSKSKNSKYVYAGSTFYINDGSETFKIKVSKGKIKGYAYSVEKTSLKTKEKVVTNYESYKDLQKAFAGNITIGKTAASVKLGTPVVEKTKEVKFNERRKKNSPIEETYFEHGINDKKTRFKIYKIGDHYELHYFDHVLTKGVVGGKTVEKTFESGKVDYVREGGTEIQFDSLENVKKYLEQIEAVRKDGKNWRTMHENTRTKSVAKEIVKQETSKAKGKSVQKSAKVESKAETVEYKSIQETKDIVNAAKAFIEQSLGKNVKVSFPRGVGNFSSKVFTELNNVKQIQTQAKHVVNLLSQASLRAYDTKNSTYVNLGKIGNLIKTESILDSVQKIIESSKSETAQSKATRNFEIALNKTVADLLEQRDISSLTRSITNQRRIVKSKISRIEDITTDYVAKNGVDFMFKPIYDLKANYRGGTTTYKAKDVRANFESVRNMYNEIGKNPNLYPNIPYEAELSILLDSIIDSIGEGEVQVLHYQDGTTGERTIWGGLSAETMDLMKQYIEQVSNLTNRVKASLRASVRPAVEQSIPVIQKALYGKNKNVLAKLFRAYKRGFAPTYTVLRQIFGGNTAIAQALTTDVQLAINEKQLYVGDYHQAINEKLKELKIRKTFDSKKVVVNGKTISVDQALYLYISLNVEANYNAINEDGLKYYDENGNTKDFAGKGNAEALKAEVNKVLPDNYKKLGDWLLGTMNDSIKSDYIGWYEKRFGKYHNRNEIGKIKENSYWTLRRFYERATNVEKAVSNPEAIFSNAKHRTNSHNEVMIGGALSTFTTYIDKLSTELFTKPVYRTAFEIYNTKGADGKTIYEILKDKVDPQDMAYVDKSMADMVGALKNTQDIFTGIMSRFSVAKLSLNIGSMLKQFASIWTSNLPIYRSTKALIAKPFHSADFKAEFKKLVNEIGGLKYRSMNNVVIDANADGLKGLSQKIAKAGMYGITKMDLFTIYTGVQSLMYVGQDQFGYKIGSEENFKFVKEQWSEFELSQIGSGALSKNAMSRGDYGTLSKALFSFLQGANRAALGSQINKIDLWKRNHKLNGNELKKALTEANKNVKEFEEAHKIEDQFNAANLNEEDVEEYTKLKTTQLDAKLAYQDFQRYKIAGGKAIPVNMAAGLIAQGMFIALINELMKHLKGKKDWDEWDFFNLDLLLTTFVDWIPLVNSASSLVQGYDVQVPAVELLNSFGDIFEAGKDGDYKSMLRRLIFLVGDMTGVPAQTIYQYIYGTVKTFDPAMAYELQSVLYGTSAQSVSKSINTYIDKGDTKKVSKLLEIALDKFRVKSSQEVRDEIANLLVEGYGDVMPKQYMTEYKDENGETVKLTAEQITQFRELYDLADDKVKALMNKAGYNNLTSEEKAKLIKKIYDAYYQYAKAVVTKNNTGGTRLSNLVALTNGKIDISRYLIALNKIASITATKKKTRKEMVIAYVNRLSGLSKQEKLLIINLAGFSTNEKNEKALINFLTSKGMSKKDALEFV